MKQERKKILAKNIKTLRINKGMTQTSLANKVGICEASISLIERGGQIPSAFAVFDIAKVLGVDVNEIFKGFDC